MAKSDEEKLIITLEARVTDMEKGLQRASKTASKRYKEIGDGAKQTADKMESSFGGASKKVTSLLQDFGKGLVAGVVAGGIAGLVGQFGEVANSIAEIGRSAKIAGIDVEKFQELKYVAEQNRIGVDSLTDGLKELSLRGSEFATTGKGSAAEAFQAIGIGADDLKKKLKDPSELFIEIIARLGQLDKASQLRLSDELFGGNGGEKFVQLISDGEAGIRKTIQAGRDLGVVMDRELIDQATELDKQFNIVATTVGSTLKQAIVNAATGLGVFIDMFRDIENKQTNTLNNRLSEIGLQRLDIENKILETMDEQRNTTGLMAGAVKRNLDVDIADLKAKKDALAADEKRIVDTLSNRLTSSKTPAPQVYNAPVVPIIVPPKPPTAPKKDADTISRDKAAAAAEREADKVRKLISDLEFEQSLVGKSAVEKEKMIAVRHAGAAATETEKTKIEGLVEATYKANEAFEQTQDRLKEINDTAREVTGDIVEGFLDGKKGADIFADSLKKIGNILINDVLDGLFKVNGAGGGGGGGLLGGLFSSLLGGGGGGFAGGGNLNYFPPVPGFAKGTNNAPGGLSIVGENGPELLNLKKGSQVIPNNKLSGMTAPKGSASGNTTVPINFQINAAGADPATVARLTEELQKVKRDLPATIVTTMTTAKKTRHPVWR